MILRARQFTLTFPCPVIVMGVVNVTPDSFSDGGQFFDAGKAVCHARQLVDEGAGILDIGGESTRPGSERVSECEELRRVIPVIEALAPRVSIPISIDTTKPAVVKAALAAGASIVNDVAANRAEDSMWRLVADAGAGYVCMHMQGTPQTMQAEPVYSDVVREVDDFFRERLQRLKHCGVKPEQVVLDVGIGFGKTVEHNLQLLAGLHSFTKLERPLLLGVSRKSFIGKIVGASSPGFRVAGSLACTCLAVAAGVQLIRAHDVAETVQAVRMAEAILAQRKI